MKRFWFERFCLTLILVGLSTLGAGAQAPDPSTRPNVIIINADDLGYGDLSCYGATLINTPNIDALADRGRRFTDAHSASAVCSPSRYGLLTGAYPLRANLWGPVNFRHRLVIDPNQTTLGSLFQDAGYATACIGKWHLGIGEEQTDWNGTLAPGPNACGFDYYFGHAVVNSSSPYVYVENDGVVGYDPEDPFVYGQRSVTEEYPAKHGLDRIGGADAAHRLYRDHEVGTTLVERATQWIQERADDEPYLLYLATTNIHHPFTPAEPFVGTSGCGLYGDFVHELDWMVGEIVRAAEARGDLDNTLIIFMSDNGGMLNVGGQEAWEAGHRLNGPLLGFKFGIWEGGHRIPMIAAWPGRIPEGTTSDHLISQVDFLATFAVLLSPWTGQATVSSALDSINQLPELFGETETPLRDQLVVLSNSQRHVSIRTQRWLYIPARNEGGFRARNWGDHTLGGAAALRFTDQINSDVDEEGNIRPDAPPAQLYDLIADPSQTRNIYEDHPDVVRTLQTQVDLYREQIGEGPPNGWAAPE